MPKKINLPGSIYISTILAANRRFFARRCSFTENVNCAAVLKNQRFSLNIAKCKQILFFSILFLSFPVWADSKPISLTKVMDLAENNSRTMSEVELQKIAAEKKINVEKAAYYPTLDAQAIGPAGFPGSTDAVGVGGLMGSPYRDGPAAGLLAQQLIYDFGQTKHAVEEAKYNAQYSKENEKVTAYEVKQFALDTYYDCANFRTQRNIWKHLK